MAATCALQPRRGGSAHDGTAERHLRPSQERRGVPGGGGHDQPHRRERGRGADRHLRDITPQIVVREQLERMVAERTEALEGEIRRREEAQNHLVRIQRLEALGSSGRHGPRLQ